MPLAPFPGQAPPAQNPTSLFPDPVLVLAPHADDETLGCGGTLAALARTHQIHIAVATDGRRSPLTERGRVTDEVESLIRTR
ncbi:MAG: PIG-L family deacetylase, partial [Pseudomonadota bacterium]